MKTNSRYPYTYAADYLRENVKNDDGSILSRSVMAHVQQVIADALGLENEIPISNALADKFIKANVEAMRGDDDSQPDQKASSPSNAPTC